MQLDLNLLAALDALLEGLLHGQRVPFSARQAEINIAGRLGVWLQ
ncbi:hypothetical protein [Streptomyces kaniharaensis]|nr:hypothetical protein [Streptomyces kaniharaensis]